MSTPPALEAIDITKSFGLNTVLHSVNLALQSGRVHALVGENGAGKSTLIKILTGSYSSDTGQLRVNGVEHTFGHPRDALAVGVGVVPQEREIVPELSAAENVLLHRQPRRGVFIDHKAMAAQAKTWLDRVGLAIDPDQRAGDLSVAEQQLLEIARGLSLRADVLLLDEPTASLTQRETDGLLEVLRKLRDEGVALVYVSHKLSEVYAIAESVTVLRDGHVTMSSHDLAAVSRAELVSAMVGRDVASKDAETRTTPLTDITPRLEMRNVATAYGHRQVNLTIRPGEIFGLYGIVGSGRSELAAALIGKIKITEGEVTVGGRPLLAHNPADALQRFNIGYVSEDRKGEGLILDFPVRRNVSLTILDKISLAKTYIRPAAERAAVTEAIQRVSLDTSRSGSRTGDLSGGNQQKVSVAKWIAGGVQTLIVDEPTVGVDVAAKEDIYQVIRNLAADGAAVLLISSELEEVIRLSDQIGVMVDGTLRTVLDNSHLYAEMGPAIMHEITRVPEQV